MFDLLGQLEKLINEHGSSEILKTHVELLREKMALSDKENEVLKAKVGQLEQENATLRRRGLPDLPVPPGFRESYGVFWRPRGNVGFESEPYCPKCVLKMRLMRREKNGQFFNCSVCDYEISHIFPPRLGET